MSTDQNPTEQYADDAIEDGEYYAPDRKVGDIFAPSGEEKDSYLNLNFYELAQATVQFGELHIEPIRTGIVAAYTDNNYGYLIQESKSGFRFILVQAGELDDFGPFLKTQRAATRSALDDWRQYSKGSISWDWISDLTRDAAAPTIDAEQIAAYLATTAAAKALTPKKLTRISRGLAEHLAG